MLVFTRVQLNENDLKLSTSDQMQRALDLVQCDMEDRACVNDLDTLAILDLRTDSSETFGDAEGPGYRELLPYFSSAENLTKYLRQRIPTPAKCKRNYTRNMKAAQKIMDELKDLDLLSNKTKAHDHFDAIQLLKYAQYWECYAGQYLRPMDLLDWNNTWQDEEYEDIEGNDTEVLNLKVSSAAPFDEKLPPTHIVIQCVSFDTQE